MLFTNFFVVHNIALSAADHAGQLFWHMFLQNHIAKDYTQKLITMRKYDFATSKCSEGLAALHLFNVIAGRCAGGGGGGGSVWIVLK